MLAVVRLIAFLLLGVAMAAPSYGQSSHGPHHSTTSQVPRYTPSSPTVSPYVNLLSRNGSSAAANYFGLIRPLEHQQAINEIQSLQTSGQQQQLNQLREDQQLGFEQPKIKPTGTAGWFQTTGKTSPYQMTSHYYGQWPEHPKSTRRASGHR